LQAIAPAQTRRPFWQSPAGKAGGKGPSRRSAGRLSGSEFPAQGQGGEASGDQGEGFGWDRIAWHCCPACGAEAMVLSAIILRPGLPPPERAPP